MATKKKFGALGWLAVGCLAFLLLAGIGFTTCTYFVGKKAKEVLEDISENPSTAVELLLKANPHLELVETHDDGTMTIRDTKSGKQVTLDWSEIAAGRISFESEEGTVEVNPETGVTVRNNQDGEETVYGAGADQSLPEWVPVASGIKPQVLMSGPDTGLYIAETATNFSTLGDFYRQRLESASYSLTVTESPESITINGQHESDGRTVVVSISADDDGDGSAVRVSWDQ